MRTWSFYDKRTGLFLGRQFSGPEKHLQSNTRTGTVALEGRFNPLSQRVDLETGAVVAYERPAAEVEAEQQAARKQHALQRIAALELEQLRPMRELVLNGSEAARERLAEIEAEIAGLRTLISNRGA